MGLRVRLWLAGGPQRPIGQPDDDSPTMYQLDHPMNLPRRFTDLVGMPPSTYRRHAARATAGMPSCMAKQVTKPIRNREAPVTEPQLE